MNIVRRKKRSNSDINLSCIGYTAHHQIALNAAKEGNIEVLKMMIRIGATDFHSMMKMARQGNQTRIIRYLDSLL
jgi:hypothetical protein